MNNQYHYSSDDKKNQDNSASLRRRSIMSIQSTLATGETTCNSLNELKNNYRSSENTSPEKLLSFENCMKSQHDLHDNDIAKSKFTRAVEYQPPQLDLNLLYDTANQYRDDLSEQDDMDKLASLMAENLTQGVKSINDF